MKSRMILPVLMLIAGAFLTGCRHEGAYAGRSHKGFVESGTVYFYDKALSKAVAIDAQEYSELPHGALQVNTVIRNRLQKPIVVECSTEFKNANSVGVGDVTGWEVISLQPLASVTYTSMSTTTEAELFTVRVRGTTK